MHDRAEVLTDGINDVLIGSWQPSDPFTIRVENVSALSERNPATG